MIQILGKTVDATLKYGTHAKIVQKLVTKICGNKRNLEHNIINVYPIMKLSEKHTGMQIRLDS